MRPGVRMKFLMPCSPLMNLMRCNEHSQFNNSNPASGIVADCYLAHFHPGRKEALLIKFRQSKFWDRSDRGKRNTKISEAFCESTVAFTAAT